MFRHEVQRPLSEFLLLSKYVVCDLTGFYYGVALKLMFKALEQKEETLKTCCFMCCLMRMGLLNSVILIIAFLFLVFTFPPGALAVVIVWLCLQLIKKRRRVNEKQK